MSIKDITVTVDAEDNFTRAAVAEIIEGGMMLHFRNVNNGVSLEQEVAQEGTATLFDALIAARGLDEVAAIPVYIEEALGDEPEESSDENQTEEE